MEEEKGGEIRKGELGKTEREKEGEGREGEKYRFLHTPILSRAGGEERRPRREEGMGRQIVCVNQEERKKARDEHRLVVLDRRYLLCYLFFSEVPGKQLVTGAAGPSSLFLSVLRLVADPCGSILRPWVWFAHDLSGKVVGPE